MRILKVADNSQSTFAGQNIFVSKRWQVKKFGNSEKQFLQVVFAWQSAAANRCVYEIVAGRWSIGLLIIILLLWLVGADVFQMPQLHKHLIVTCNPFWTHASGAGRTKRRSSWLVSKRFCWTKNGSFWIWRPHKKSVKKNCMQGVKKWNRGYWGLELLLSGKSYKCRRLFKCCDLFHFRPEYNFLAFFMQSWFFVSFVSRQKKNKTWASSWTTSKWRRRNAKSVIIFKSPPWTIDVNFTNAYSWTKRNSFRQSLLQSL
jgi:hypothetical protein